MNKLLLLFLGIVVGTTLAAKDFKGISYYEKDAPVVGDVAYRNKRCKLDLRIPDNKKNFPTIVWFHGGGLRSGKKYYPPCIDTTQIGVVIVNYRLSGKKAACPDYLYDAAAAAAWTLKNIEKYGGSPKHVYISGQSAGGYLSAMLALDKKYLNAFKVQPTDFAGFFPISGQMTTHFQILAERRKKDPSVRDFAVDEYAPVYHAAKETPYMKFFCGDALYDWPARVEENQLLVMRMQRVYGNQNVFFYSIPSSNHRNCTAPSMALVNDELVQLSRKISKPVKP